VKNPWSLTTAETEVMDFFIVTGCRKGVAKQRDCSTKVVDALLEKIRWRMRLRDPKLTNTTLCVLAWRDWRVAGDAAAMAREAVNA